MPYILPARRELFKGWDVRGLLCESPRELSDLMFELCTKFLNGELGSDAVNGDLNYCISMAVKGYLSKFGMIKYQRCDDAIKAYKFLEREIEDAYWDDVRGTVECAKLELYTNVIRKYEILKEQENGSI